MRLFLSSQDLGNYGQVAAKMAGKNKKAFYIRNAQDYLPDSERNESTAEKQEMFESLGFEFKELDLRDYFGRKADLAKKLSGIGSLWASGGNPYILRRAYQASGFDEILIDLLNNDKVLYGGWSAGAMVTAPDLHGPNWSREDRSTIVPKGYQKRAIFKGLNLVDFYVVPHMGSPLHGNSPNKLAEFYEIRKLPHYVLSDGQVVVVDGDKTKLLK